jgi:hypothetical protein
MTHNTTFYLVLMFEKSMKGLNIQGHVWLPYTLPFMTGYRMIDRAVIIALIFPLISSLGWIKYILLCFEWEIATGRGGDWTVYSRTKTFMLLLSLLIVRDRLAVSGCFGFINLRPI